MVWVEAKERFKRLKICFYILEILTVIFSIAEKVLTFYVINGAKEANLIPRLLIENLGLGPACIIGFFISIVPLGLIHFGIRKLKLNKEYHYWLYTILMTIYFTYYFKTFKNNLSVYQQLRG